MFTVLIHYVYCSSNLSKYLIAYTWRWPVCGFCIKPPSLLRNDSGHHPSPVFCWCRLPVMAQECHERAISHVAPPWAPDRLAQRLMPATGGWIQTQMWWIHGGWGRLELVPGGWGRVVLGWKRGKEGAFLVRRGWGRRWIGSRRWTGLAMTVQAKSWPPLPGPVALHRLFKFA